MGPGIHAEATLTCTTHPNTIAELQWYMAKALPDGETTGTKSSRHGPGLQVPQIPI